MTIRHASSTSPYQITFLKPDQRVELRTQGHTFVAYEQTRPLKQQTPLTPRIIGLLDQLNAAYDQNAEAERQRIIASDQLKQLNKKALTMVNKIWKSVTAKYEDDPSQATHWGFKMKPSTRNVLRPKKLNDRLMLLNAYIAQEESRPEEERFRVPELAQVIDLRDRLTTNTLAYQTGQKEQENSFEAIKTLTFDLCECLEGAGIHLLGVDYHFKLSTQLQNWGYDISLKRKSAGAKETEPAAAPEDAPSTNGTTALNGAAQVKVAVDEQSNQ
ncbi:MAG: hypothetical protein H6631_16785 [Anaerolineaceae bacterium]|nr:hypothetical protein [Anaerolineaceae bacterium]MCB9099624.1 hypothetical protein [Anaerolineales bacterium]